MKRLRRWSRSLGWRFQKGLGKILLQESYAGDLTNVEEPSCPSKKPPSLLSQLPSRSCDQEKAGKLLDRRILMACGTFPVFPVHFSSMCVLPRGPGCKEGVSSDLWPWDSEEENVWVMFLEITYALKGFPLWLKESSCNAGDLGSIRGLGRSPGEGKGYPLQYSGLYSPWGCKESDTTEWLSFFTYALKNEELDFIYEDLPASLI